MIPLDDDRPDGSSSKKRPTQSDSPRRVPKGEKQKPLKSVGPEDEDRRVFPGEAGANDD